MIDTKELSRKLRSDDLIDHVDIHANVKPVLTELINRLEAAEKEIDALRNEIACVKEVEFPRKVRVVADAWKGKCKRLEAERDALRAALQHETDCLEAAKAEIEALRAKIAEMEKQEPVAEWVENRFHHYPQLVWKDSYRAIVGEKLYTKLYALPGAKGE